MRITVLFFALARDRAGMSSAELYLPAGSTVRDASRELVSRFPAIAPLVSKLAFAVNQQYAQLTSELHDGDELALIPPVSGG